MIVLVRVHDFLSLVERQRFARRHCGSQYVVHGWWRLEHMQDKKKRDKESGSNEGDAAEANGAVE